MIVLDHSDHALVISTRDEVNNNIIALETVVFHNYDRAEAVHKEATSKGFDVLRLYEKQDDPTVS